VSAWYLKESGTFKQINYQRRDKRSLIKLQDPKEICDHWLSVVSDYCQLNLTDESDGLLALLGLASHFQSQATGIYVAGMWENDLVRSRYGLG
jgi:hypothetical protein